MHYVSLAETVNKPALESTELPVVYSAVKLRLSGSTEEYAIRDLEQELLDLSRLLRLELPAGRVRACLRRRSSLSGTFWDAYKLLGYLAPEAFEGTVGLPVPPPGPDSRLDDALAEIRRYYRAAFMRSEQLFQAALDADWSPTRVVVCSRFQADEIMRLAGNQTCVAVVGPFPESLDADAPKWWTSPHLETCES
jgi:hypothetical protein